MKEHGIIFMLGFHHEQATSLCSLLQEMRRRSRLTISNELLHRKFPVTHTQTTHLPIILCKFSTFLHKDNIPLTRHDLAWLVESAHGNDRTIGILILLHTAHETHTLRRVEHLLSRLNRRCSTRRKVCS